MRAPAVSPPVMNRWKMRNKTMIGRLLIRLAPISWFQIDCAKTTTCAMGTPGLVLSIS